MAEIQDVWYWLNIHEFDFKNVAKKYFMETSDAPKIKAMFEEVAAEDKQAFRLKLMDNNHKEYSEQFGLTRSKNKNAEVFHATYAKKNFGRLHRKIST